MQTQLSLIGEDDRIIERFLDRLDEACTMLDVLAQLQSLAGTSMMQSKAGKTNEVHAEMKNYAAMLRHAQNTRASLTAHVRPVFGRKPAKTKA